MILGLCIDFLVDIQGLENEKGKDMEVFDISQP